VHFVQPNLAPRYFDVSVSSLRGTPVISALDMKFFHTNANSPHHVSIEMPAVDAYSCSQHTAITISPSMVAL
jgi:hypothetical protein